MIFLVLNILLAVFIIWCSLHVTTKNFKSEGDVINLLVLVGATAIVLSVALWSGFWGPERLTIILNHTLLVMNAAIFIFSSEYFIGFSTGKNPGFVKAISYILIAVAIFVSSTKLQVVDFKRMIIVGAPVFSGNLATLIPLNWYELYRIIFYIAIPFFSMIIMLLQCENSGSRLLMQKAEINLLGLVVVWAGLVVVNQGASSLPMLRTLYLYFYGIMVLVFARAVSHDKIYDISTLTSSTITSAVQYLLPATVGALLYVALRPIYNTSHWQYILIIVVVLYAVIMASSFLVRALSRFTNFRSAQYDTAFENALAEIDYEGDSPEICNALLTIFKDYVFTKDMTVLIDSGSGNELSTAFTSNNNNFTISSTDRMIDVLLNNNISILFKEDIVVNHVLSEVQNELEELFTKSQSEALIIMNEGRHVLGIIFLAAKRTGGSYDDYDKNVFTKLYSYFFVFGYYMKNIANASVVGTVNREIKMSAQIITSIQENMDRIDNPKMDVGYLMLPAHNIGGEFVDMIHLTATRHIFVIGSVSGKGISASMSMVILKSAIRTFLTDTHDFKKLIQKVNAFIRSDLPKGTFFAGLFCLVDFATDTMYYVNCGIPTMLLYTQAYNNVIEVQGKGYVLGFVKNISPILKVKQMHLNPGDIVGVTTDGLISSHSLRGEQFGKDRIKDGITDNNMYPANRMVAFTVDKLKKFMSKELESDITILYLKYLDKDTIVEIPDETKDANIAGESQLPDVDDLVKSIQE